MKPDDIDQARPQGPSERDAITRQRVHQSFFRQAIVSSYNATCCITGITVSECLIASHIVPWSVNERLRADPTNGLCLSATFDRLFDAGLMTVTNDLTVRFADRLLRDTGPSIRQLIVVYEGQPIQRPTRFLPSNDCLNWHHKHVFEKQ
ncbi:MAG: HNH endonuclease [Phycisphaeraceae bacterium]|nr:HNH endonuclease [Phycisphaeraceae bacterium]